MRIMSGRCLGRQRDAFGACCRLERLEPGGAEEISGEPPVLLVVLHDQHAGHGRILRLVPIRLVLAEDHFLVREGVRGLLESQVRTRGRRRLWRPRLSARSGGGELPTSSSPTSACLPGDVAEGIEAAALLAERIRTLGSSCSAIRQPDIRARAPEETAAPARVPPEGAHPGSGPARVGDPRRGGGRLDDRLESRRRVGWGEYPTRSRRSISCRRESATYCARWLRARAMRRSAEALFLTERSVEKVIHSIFLKLELTWETLVHKRVKAVLLYLAESLSVISAAAADSGDRVCAARSRGALQPSAERFDAIARQRKPCRS